MELQLPFNVPEIPSKINLQDRILLNGSCFSENIGKLLREYKFNCSSNPVGTIYNPYSLFKILEDALDRNYKPDIVENQSVFFDWNTHSELSALSEEKAIELNRNAYHVLSDFLQKTDWIIISPGSAWVYELQSTGQIVANCHKIPQKNFRKFLLTPEAISAHFFALKEKLEIRNITPKWIFTISPVRHVRDGLVENNQSKSVLHLAIRNILDKYPDDCYYFPSYEILIDQLRDYRFYSRDLVHPSAEAVNYIWEQLVSACFSNETKEFITKWSAIRRAVAHRASHPASKQHQDFLRQTISSLHQLSNTVDTSREISELKKQIF